MNNFLKEFKDRGYYYQCTNELELSNLLNKESTNAYIGFDSTAPSLHVGSLLQIMCLRLLQKHGHRPIVLLGGGTTRIVDPSGNCLLYTSPSPRDGLLSRMPSSA